MYSLPYTLSIIIAIVVFAFAYRYINRIFANAGIPGGMVRLSIVGFLALLIALIVGSAVDWVAEPSNGIPSLLG